VRGLTTALVVAGVALVGVLAAADALRGDDDPEALSPSSRPTVSTEQPSLQETLRREVVLGVLLYSDEDCRVHTLLLPPMIDQRVEETGRLCRFDTTDGWVLRENEVLSPNWRFVASCRDGEIVVRDARTGRVHRRIDGCKPTWRPRIGNRLTWVRDGAIYERGRPLLTAGDLRAAAREHPNLAFVEDDVRIGVHVRALAWLATDHLAASLEIRAERSAPEFLLVLFEGREVIVAATNFRTSPRRLFGAPAGSFVAGDDGTIVTIEGNVIDPPAQIPDPHSVSPSPDERWLAYATENRIYLVPTPRNNDPNRILTIPRATRDLAWQRVTTSLTFPRAIR
jgi:hypothetical protein